MHNEATWTGSCWDSNLSASPACGWLAPANGGAGAWCCAVQPRGWHTQLCSTSLASLPWAVSGLRLTVATCLCGV